MPGTCDARWGLLASQPLASSTNRMGCTWAKGSRYAGRARWGARLVVRAVAPDHGVAGYRGYLEHWSAPPTAMVA